MTAAAFQKSSSRVLPKLADHRDRQPQLPTAPRLGPSTVKGMGGGQRVARGVDKPNIVLQWLGRAIGPMIEEEKKRSAIAGKIPWPGMGAARIWDWHVGWFHQHAHWPGIPLPSTGPLIPLPWGISGADKTTINGQPAARCGDFGLGLWCGGWMPMNEVYLGSATVWIESARAARTMDVTDHCVLLDPAASPLSKGMIVQSSGDVKIGGMPLPSMTQMAIAAGMWAVAKGVKGAPAIARRAASLARAGFAKARVFFAHAARFATELRTLARFIHHADSLGDNLAGKLKTAQHLRTLSKVAEARKILDEIVDTGKRADFSTSGKRLPSCVADDMLEGSVKTVDTPTGGLMRQIFDQDGRLRGATPADIAKNGARSGSGFVVHYDPFKPVDLGNGVGVAPPEIVLIHELTHGRDFAQGIYPGAMTWKDPAMIAKYQDLGERRAIELGENPVRRHLGIPPRARYQPTTLIL